MNQLYVYLKQCKLSVMIGKVEWKNISWSKTRRAETNEMTYYEHQSCVYTLCRNHFTSNTVVHKK